ncbi:hypothetical protein LK09_02680 [Microbacterium mangrovi]|uniref:Uncharacterized protein n=1 Tax=Microbacterium mangrovi TaxID=1348253 RepID=A0A0B2AD25_9MICO|nr:hypothetical protein [Microbacterium mangrovi]KHK99546.1 hypothetical protein LK09_02680 [Microbacterium mangrovi]
MSDLPETMPPRPPLVTAAVVLVYVGAMLAVVFGVLAVLSRYDTADPGRRTAITFTGIGIVLFGLLGLSVASGMSRGSRLSQRLVSLFAVLQIGAYAVTLFTAGRLSGTQWTGIVVATAVLIALWTPRSRRWFRRSVPASA